MDHAPSTMAPEGNHSVTVNKSQGVRVVDHGSDKSEDIEAQDSERDKSKDDVGLGMSKENRDLADVAELDPLAESISMLHSVGEALGKEVQKLTEIGDDTWESTVENVDKASSSRVFSILKNREISPRFLQKHVKTLKQDDYSEREAEIEEIEADTEDLFKHKVEEEIQYLTISKALEKLRNKVVYQNTISDELKTTSNVVRDAQNHVNLLKGQAERLGTRVGDTVETEQVQKLQKRVRQIALRLFLQLSLLVLVVVSFVFHSSTQDGDVPT